MIKVIKRDGSLQEFDEGKIVRIAKAAGLEEAEAVDLGNEVEAWAIAQNKKITTMQIRDLVLEGLRKRDEYAANMYEWYEERKHETHDK